MAAKHARRVALTEPLLRFVEGQVAESRYAFREQGRARRPAAPDGAGRRAEGCSGETGALVRAHNRAATPLRQPEGWPQALRTAASLMLASRQPAYVAWGPDLVSLHIDGYLPFRHQAAARARGSLRGGLARGPRPDAPRDPGAPCGRGDPLRGPAPGPGGSRPTLELARPLADAAAGRRRRVAGLHCTAVETTATVLARGRQAAERERLARMFEQAPASWRS